MFRYIKELLSKVMPLEEQMKIPYGLTDLKTIITDGYVYCDRTDKIPFLETARSQLFFRPKGFGKSLLLSMLANYYDVAAKDSFKQVFGGLSIGKNPTALKSSFVILALNFSCVDSLGSAEITQNSLSQHVNARIKRAVSLYREKKIDLNHVRIHEKNPLASLESFVTAASIAGYPVYLLIDEYDDFVRTCFLNSHTKEKELQRPCLTGSLLPECGRLFWMRLPVDLLVRWISPLSRNTMTSVGFGKKRYNQ
jgi:hypothetical protein